jgi:hypothetical protein
MTTVIAMCLMANAACGYSPLLNHTQPVRAPVNEIARTEDSLDCRFEFNSGNICADFVWVKEPNGSGVEGSAKIYFWLKSNPGVFVSPLLLDVGVKLWMPDMGHGSQKVKVAPALSANGQKVTGIYDATEVMFVMGGDWDIHLELKEQGTGKIIESKKVSYHVQ